MVAELLRKQCKPLVVGKSGYISSTNKYFGVIPFAAWNTHIILIFSCIDCFELMLCSVEHFGVLGLSGNFQNFKNGLKRKLKCLP